MSSEIPRKIKNILFVASHLILSLKTRERQLAVGMELKAPPNSSTWEDFPRLPLTDAAKVILTEEKH